MAEKLVLVSIDDDHKHPASCGSDPVLTSLQSVAGRGFNFLCVQHSVKHVLGPGPGSKWELQTNQSQMGNQ